MEDITKLIKLAHKNITRIKGKDYAPSAHELQTWIDEYLSKHNEGDVTEKWSEKYKRSIDCNNPKGFSQRAHCQGRKKHETKESSEDFSPPPHETETYNKIMKSGKKSETKESMGADSSGSFEPAFGGEITKREIYKIHNSKKYGKI